MQALFIHGMGRTPLSGRPLLRKLRSNGIPTSTFGYATAIHTFSQISNRLFSRIEKLAGDGDYILIGHSLGGVLLRSALATLPAGTRAPTRVFLLGSPTRAARLAKSLSGNPVFRIATGDCGQLLASDVRIMAVPAVAAPTTAICGDRGMWLTRGAFRGEPNDGVVSVSETSAAWISNATVVPVVHTFLPASARVAEIIMESISRTSLR
jgi:pimeloyl-ACP methyl ester carboxylesterase